MLSIFKSNQPVVILFLLAYSILLKLGLLVDYKTIPIEFNGGILYELLIQPVVHFQMLHAVLSIILIFAQAIFLNLIVNRYRLMANLTYLSAACYIAITSSFKALSLLSPGIFALTFILISISKLFAVYKVNEARGKTFDVGFWLGVAGLFYYPYLYLYFFFIIGLIMIRPFDLKEHIVLLTGILVPNFLVGVYLYWIDNMPAYFNNFIIYNTSILEAQTFIDYIVLAKIIFVTLLIAISILFFQNRRFRNSVEVRKFYVLNMWMLLIGLCIVLALQILNATGLVLLIIPIVVFISYFFDSIKSRLLTEFIHIIIVILVYSTYIFKYFI